ncbi:hypothetical protein SAY87_030410 [Trapa incisa]|uniref:Uncharacterized protein n=1 Tax=Trapa incisa TaxID=236973 RepID=A0AAN7QLR6_9MYRT|nr:hypothetical protein SAY87_030410 [Trapa incisa]
MTLKHEEDVPDEAIKEELCDLVLLRISGKALGVCSSTKSRKLQNSSIGWATLKVHGFSQVFSKNFLIYEIWLSFPWRNSMAYETWGACRALGFRQNNIPQVWRSNVRQEPRRAWMVPTDLNKFSAVEFSENQNLGSQIQ